MVSASTSKSAGTFSLVPSARLQRFLGRELIADPNLAVIEFVKNGYDAGASRVVLDFKLRSPTRQLVVSDDGIGMDIDAFQSNWMRPGFSEKSPDAPPGARPRARRTPADQRRVKRKQLGEKGLGRLASGRLGDVLEVYTRRVPTDEWLHVTFDWRNFEDMTKAMSEVPIPFDTQPPSFDAGHATGTIIVISGLRLRWEGRVPGRPVAGRSRTRLGRLKQDLSWLLRPLDDSELDFAVDIRSDLFDSTRDLGVVTPSSAQRDADYRYEFTLDIDARERPIISRRLLRSPELAGALGEKRTQTFKPVRLDADSARRLNRPETLSCGRLTGVFLYTPPPKGRRAASDDAVGHGVLLYRDGALVEPYGLDGNDWVGVEARKAQRQGHALIQPNTLSGEIRISREHNPDLTDMANRQGLLDNEASSEFIAHVQAEFRDFETIIEPELVRRHYKSKPEQAAEGAEQRLALARARMRAVSHRLRQPLLGLTGEMKILEQLARREDLPAGVRDQLLRVSAAASEYVRRAEVELTRLTDLKVSDYVGVTSKELATEAADEAKDTLAEHGVTLTVDVASNRELVLPKALVVDALAELLRNAAEAPRPAGRKPTVTMILADHGTRDVAVRISDNGAGMDGVAALTPLSEVTLATKARPSGGLMMVEESVTVIRGSVKLVDNGGAGVTIIIVLPGRMEGLASHGES